MAEKLHYPLLEPMLGEHLTVGVIVIYHGLLNAAAWAHELVRNTGLALLICLSALGALRRFDVDGETGVGPTAR